MANVWFKKWENAKEGIWQPKFLELMVKTITSSKGIEFKEGATDAPYTLIVDVQWIYPGWDAWVMKQAAKVTMVLKFVETQNKDKELFQLRSIEAPGDQFGNNFSNESRIGEGFAKRLNPLESSLSNALKNNNYNTLNCNTLVKVSKLDKGYCYLLPVTCHLFLPFFIESRFIQ